MVYFTSRYDRTSYCAPRLLPEYSANALVCMAVCETRWNENKYIVDI